MRRSRTDSGRTRRADRGGGRTRHTDGPVTFDVLADDLLGLMTRPGPPSEHLVPFELDARCAEAPTEFQLRVWSELRKIPFGKTWSYRELAERVGNPGAVRAVGSANGRNPVCIFIPCHRVVRTGGELGGYAGGLENKALLLDLENGRKSR